MLYTLVILVSIYFIDCKHIVTVDKDFSKIKTNQELAQHVKEILNRLKTFKVPVHPRIRLFYELLKQGMTKYAHKTSDSLYKPDKFNLRNDNRL
ncbi:hypothetical protein O3G_MSEX014794 [Manduca sexta]|uniref:Uncharacterized protein n=1 Tax=Manduca sexta TaxID=7130 RepID=A0A921ZWM3_MANSE|nr:hypothetical protein O3G_MSEX014794 [Manduca sexta]